MPTYVYRRPDGTCFEAFQKISDAPLATDPETGVPVERVITGGAGLQFKGSGFYLTDYARAGAPSGDRPKAETSDAPAASESKPAGGSTPADSKPAAKAAPKE